MKKFNIKKMNRKTFFLSLVLLIAVIGVGITVALSVAKTDPVVNSFEVGKIDTGIEENVKGDLTKEVKVTNEANAKSDAFVRVRINVPNGITLNFSADATDTWTMGDDGFYYFRYSVAPGTSTTELLSSVGFETGMEEEIKQTGFDVTIYQESCIATEEHPYVVGGENSPLELSVIINAFENATTTTE